MVRCANCGFLAAQEMGTRTLIEVDCRIRNPDREGVGAIETRRQHEMMPLCFALAVNLQDEPECHTAKGTHTCIHRERECSSFTKYYRGFSPKEHREMLNQKDLLDRQNRREQEERERLERLRKDDLEWKAGQEETSRL